MTVSKFVIDTHDDTNKLEDPPLDRRFTKAQKAVLSLDGTRAVDTLEGMISAREKISEGDVVKYIQDITNTEHLRAYYALQTYPRDESGNDLDEDVGDDKIGTYGRGNPAGWSRNIPYYLQLRNGADDYVSIDNANIVGTSENVINLSGMFDIFIWCRRPITSATGETVFLQKRNIGGAGIQINSKAASYAPEVKLFDSGGSQVTGSPITGVTPIGNPSSSDTSWYLIRVSRDFNNDIKLYINGVEEGSGFNDSTDFTNTGNMYFGYDGSTISDGSDMGEVRIYCKGNLTDSEAEKILSSRRVASVMKFAGVVYKVTENTHSKTFYAKSFGKILTETEISSSLLDDRDKSGSNNGQDNVFLDDSGGTRMRVNNVIEQIFEALDTNQNYRKWKVVKASGTTANFDVVSSWVMTGNFLRNVELMILEQNENYIFYTTPRKVFIIENLNILPTPSTTVGNKYEHGKNCNILQSAKDDTSLINDLEIMGENITLRRVEKNTDSEHTGGGSHPWTIDGVNKTFDLVKTPIGTVKVTSDGTEIKAQVDESTAPSSNQFRIDMVNAQVILGTAPSSSLTVEYEHEDISNLYHRNQDGTSKKQHGVRSRRIVIGGLKDFSFILGIATNLIARFKDVNLRNELRVPYLANELRNGLLLSLTNDVKDGSGGHDSLSNGDFRISAMKFLYPDSITVIQCGEHMFDYYDYDAGLATKSREILSNYAKTKNQ